MNMLQFGPLTLEYDSERGELYIFASSEVLGMVELPNEDIWSELVQWHRTRKRVEIVHEDETPGEFLDA